jgi:hypothetical protein
LGRDYKVNLRLENHESHPLKLGTLEVRVVREDGTPTADSPLRYRVPGDTISTGGSLETAISLVTPAQEGSYRLQVLGADRPFRVDFFKRIADLVVKPDLPDGLGRKEFYRLRLGLLSQADLQTENEVDLLTRFRRGTQGEYVWEIDSLLQPLNLSLKGSQESPFEVQLLTPDRPGPYTLELYAKDRATGQVIPLGKPISINIR